MTGDPAGCGALATVLTRTAGAIAKEADRVATVQVDWLGSAADSYRAAAAEQSQAGRAVAEALGAAGRLLASFALAIEAAQSTERRAIAVTGLSADDEAQRLLAAARCEAAAAQDRLAAGLRGLVGPATTRTDSASHVAGAGLSPPGPFDYADLANALVVTPAAFAKKAELEALAAGRYARSLKDATRVGSLAERTVARREWRDALRAYRDLRQAEQAYAAVARVAPVPAWLSRANTPLSASTPVLRSVPIVSVALVGASTWSDHEAGMTLPHALTKNVAATGAGMAAFSGATSVLVGAGLAGGPVVLGAVAAGFVVSWGVGQVVEHWGDDIAEAAGDAFDAVGGLAESAGEAVSDLWGWATG